MNLPKIEFTTKLEANRMLKCGNETNLVIWYNTASKGMYIKNGLFSGYIKAAPTNPE